MIKRKWKFIIPFIIIIAVIFYFAGNYSSGSLGYAEQYEFSISNIQLIKAVEKIKSGNKEFIPPSYYSEPDSVDAHTRDRFNVYFFYHDQNSVVYFVIDKDHQDINKSTINFVSINEGLTGPLIKELIKISTVMIT